jgi:hypothetical protein
MMNRALAVRRIGLSVLWARCDFKDRYASWWLLRDLVDLVDRGSRRVDHGRRTSSSRPTLGGSPTRGGWTGASSGWCAASTGSTWRTWRCQAWSRTGSWPKPSAAGWGEPAALPTYRPGAAVAPSPCWSVSTRGTRTVGRAGAGSQRLSLRTRLWTCRWTCQGLAHPDDRDVNARGEHQECRGLVVSVCGRKCQSAGLAPALLAVNQEPPVASPVVNPGPSAPG